MKSNKVVLALALALSASANAIVVPLFDATPITPSEPLGVDFLVRRVTAETTVTTYCTTPGIGEIKGVYPGDVYGPPLTDNFITGNSLLHSLCVGPLELPALATGSMCFANVPGGIVIGAPMETVFSAVGVTAPVPLPAGQNSETYRLWDYGSVYGNVKLILELPAQCGVKNEWCSPGYWKNHPQSWTLPKTDPFPGVTTYATSKKACTGLPSNPNLWEVVSNPSCYGGEATNVVGDLLSAANPLLEFHGVRNDSCPLN